MVLLGNELVIYEDIQSTSKQSRGLQGFQQIRGAGRSHEATRTTSSNWPIYEADFEGGRTQAVFEQWPIYEATPVVLNKAQSAESGPRQSPVRVVRRWRPIWMATTHPLKRGSIKK